MVTLVILLAQIPGLLRIDAVRRLFNTILASHAVRQAAAEAERGHKQEWQEWLLEDYTNEADQADVFADQWATAVERKANSPRRIV